MVEGPIPQNQFDPVNDSPTKMRTSMTRGYGGTPAYIHEGRILNVNMVNWTVDVFSQFDMKYYPDIQVSSPYLHPNRGEGIYVMPEINAKCLVCIPSDGPPPFLLAFIATQERSGQDPDDNTDSTGGLGASTYASGRPRAKPGDIFLRGRDGNFMILHRGGVLQVGATQVAQRIYIPLRNLITDVSQNYEHFNTGGCINWGISAGEQGDNPETEWRQAFRLFANNEMADIRLSVGRVHQPIPEPSGNAGETSNLNQLGIGTDENNPICLEFAVSPGAFNGETAAPDIPTAQGGTKLRFFFDRKGGVFLRSESSVLLRVKERLRIKADKGIDLETDEDFNISAGKKGRITAKKNLDIGTEGGIISMNSGKYPVARVGSVVEVTFSVPELAKAVLAPSPTGTINGAGSVTSGSDKVLV